MTSSNIIDSGYIYALINPSMEGLVKIGKTSREPSTRIKELSAATGVPTPFILAYESYFLNCSAAEDYIHTFLESRGCRVSINREFFTAPLNNVIDAILEASKLYGANKPKHDQELVSSHSQGSYGSDTNDCYQEFSDYEEPVWGQLLDMASSYHYGMNNYLQDYKEALKLYKKAGKLGSVEALERAAEMYVNGDGCVPSTENALQLLKEGINSGSGYCFAVMADIYIEEGHIENANKCWENFFISDDFGRTPTNELKERNYLAAIKSRRLPFTLEKLLKSKKEEVLSRAKISGKYMDEFGNHVYSQQYHSLMDFYSQISQLWSYQID